MNAAISPKNSILSEGVLAAVEEPALSESKGPCPNFGEPWFSQQFSDAQGKILRLRRVRLRSGSFSQRGCGGSRPCVCAFSSQNRTRIKIQSPTLSNRFPIEKRLRPHTAALT
jgi:hypothetical protein